MHACRWRQSPPRRLWVLVGAAPRALQSPWSRQRACGPCMGAMPRFKAPGAFHLGPSVITISPPVFLTGSLRTRAYSSPGQAAASTGSPRRVPPSPLLWASALLNPSHHTAGLHPQADGACSATPPRLPLACKMARGGCVWREGGRAVPPSRLSVCMGQWVHVQLCSPSIFPWLRVGPVHWWEFGQPGGCSSGHRRSPLMSAWAGWSARCCTALTLACQDAPPAHATVPARGLPIPVAQRRIGLHTECRISATQ